MTGGGPHSAYYARFELATTLFAIALIACGFGWLQFASEGLVSGDSYFHARAAEQLYEHGIERRFPQAVYSTWADRYSDKDLMFHFLLGPFTFDESQLVRRVEWLVIALDIVIFAILAWVARRLGARAVWLWLLLFASAGSWLWLHLAQARPHLLGITLLLLEIAALMRGRPGPLLALSAVHVWSHSSFVLLPGLVLCHALARRLRSEAPAFSGYLAALGGIGIASILHPYFPNNLSLAWDQIVEVARNLWTQQSGIPVDVFGGELGHLSWGAFAGSAPLWAPAGLGIVLAVARWRQRPPSVALLMTSLTSLGLLAAAAVTMRFLAFFLPVCALAGAIAWTHLRCPSSLRRWTARHPLASTGACLVSIALLVAGPIAGNAQAAAERVENSIGVRHAAAAAAYLEEHALPEDIVFHAFWTPFPSLYFHRPDGRYVVALDPVFLYRYDPELFQKMLAVYRGVAPDAYRVVTRDFGASFVFVPKLAMFDAMFQSMSRDARFRRVFADPWSIVFDVRPTRAISSGVK